MSTLKVDNIQNKAGTGTPDFPNGISSNGTRVDQRSKVDFLNDYVGGSGGFGPNITKLEGVEIPLNDGNYMGIAEIVWNHSAGFTTQGSGTVAGITLLSVTGTGVDTSKVSVLFGLTSSNRFHINSSGAGNNLDKKGTIVFTYSKP